MNKFLLSLVVSVLVCAGGGAMSFPRVVLPGDYPDPTVVRDGDDYYMTHSPFYYAPGFLIWHSRDMINWEPVTRALPEYAGSAMAPDLVKHGDMFYLYYPADGTNWVSCAKDIRGPWSRPVDLHVEGIDPGHAVDADGNRCLFLNEGEMVPLAADGLSTKGEKRKVYDGWKYPRQWRTEGMFLESPKVVFRDGYYYLTSAEGGTAGPATSHMVVSARARELDGPWENSPYNPAVHTYSDSDRLWSKGHGTLVEDAKGDWWLVYHAYRNGYHTLGRCTVVEPVEWTSDGWWHTVPERDVPETGVCDGLVLSDSFDANVPGLQWTGWGVAPNRYARCADGRLVVDARGTCPADGNKLLVTPVDKNYVAEVDVEVASRAKGGLLLYYSDKAYVGVTGDSGRFTVYKGAGDGVVVPNRYGRRFKVRVHNNCNHVDMEVSGDGLEWETVASDIDVSGMNHNVHGGFYALRPALCATGRGVVKFDDFEYRDAVPGEDEMGAYLMVFHQDATHGLHMAVSRDGYTFKTLNNGDPIMAGDTIASQRGIRDPHIFRGPDGAFYVSMTDLHVFGQRDGYRDTEWERPGEDYGWGNNRGLVLMKSRDLLNWTRSNVFFDELSSAWKEIGCAWAPELTYDAERDRLMLYLTMRHRNEPNMLYYVYVNDDFDRIETLPQLLFRYPEERTSAIDGDIIKVGDRYILSYVAHEGAGGIKQAVSSRPDGGWEFSPRWVDAEPGICEAPNVWKRIGEDRWVLMYDIYSINPHNFGFVETSDFVTFTNLGHFNEGVMRTEGFTSPKHGAVVHITTDEADRLEKYWEENARPFVSAVPVKD